MAFDEPRLRALVLSGNRVGDAGAACLALPQQARVGPGAQPAHRVGARAQVVAPRVRRLGAGADAAQLARAREPKVAERDRRLAGQR